MKPYFLTAILTLAFGLTMAQDSKPNDLIRFKDGTAFRGTITEYQEDELVKIRVGDEIRVIDSDEMDKIKDIRFNHYEYVDKVNKFWYELNVGGTFGEDANFGPNQDHPVINGLAGYQFYRLFGVGIGTGYHTFTAVNILPLYATFRGDLFNTRVTPYYYSDIGYGFALDKSSNLNFFEETASGGLLFGIGSGVKFKLKHVYLTASAGYRIQKSEVESRSFPPTFSSFFPGGETIFTEQRTYRKAEIRIGLGF